MPRRRFSQGAIQPIKAILQEIEDEENAKQSAYGKVAANHCNSTSASSKENVLRKKKKSSPDTQLLTDKSTESSRVMADINDEVFQEPNVEWSNDTIIGER